MTEFELSKCSNIKSNVLACYANHEWYTNAKPDSCVWNLFNQVSNQNCTLSKTALRDVWIELGKLGQWIFVIPKNIKFAIICGSVVFHEELSGEGLLTLNLNCIIQTQHFLLEPKRIFSSNSSEILIPSINHTELIMNHSIDTIGFHDYVHSNFSKIDHQISEIKENLQLPHPTLANVHDMHHYTMTYIIISCVIIGFVYVWRKISNLRIENPRAVLINRRISMPVLFARENVAATN